MTNNETIENELSVSEAIQEVIKDDLDRSDGSPVVFLGDGEYEEYRDPYIEDLLITLQMIDVVDMYNFLKEHVFGQDENLLKICSCIKAYISSVSNQDLTSVQKIPYHVIVAGPTGCGKTELFRAVSSYFQKVFPEFPISLRDATSVTAEGYVGEGKDYLIRDLIDSDGYGIVFVDEFDKRLLPSSSNGEVDFSAETQNGLLQLLDGANIDVDLHDEGIVSVNTNHTLFICMGAFEHDSETKTNSKIGFNSVNDVKEKKPLTFEDLIKWGGQRQLISRFCQIVEFNRIDKELLLKIIEKYRKLYEINFGNDIKIEFTDSYINALVESYDDKFGARNIRNKIWTDLQLQFLYADQGASIVLDIDSEK